MTYVAWAVLYEGSTDRAYFDVLIPRLMEEIVLFYGIRSCTIPTNPAILLSRGSVAEVAKEACEASQAFHICFIHADTGGRSLEASLEYRSTAYCQAMHDLCKWPPARCIFVSPRKETEAWILSDGKAVVSALGYAESPASIGLPMTAAEAEGLADPKSTLKYAVRQVRGRRRFLSEDALFPAIAQRQSFDILRRSRSFADFERNLRVALADIGCVSAP